MSEPLSGRRQVEPVLSTTPATFSIPGDAVARSTPSAAAAVSSVINVKLWLRSAE